MTEREQLQELSGVWQRRRPYRAAGAAVAIVIPDEADSACALRFDLGQASLQMMVVAADLGIGSGHSSVGDQDLARRVLGLPEDKIVGIIIDFGYPADRPLKPIRNPPAAVRRGGSPRPLVIGGCGSNNLDQVEVIRPAPFSRRARRGRPTRAAADVEHRLVDPGVQVAEPREPLGHRRDRQLRRLDRRRARPRLNGVETRADGTPRTE